MVRQGSGSIMVWVYMTIDGCSFIIKINGKVSLHMYKEILEVDLSSTISHYELDSRHFFFQ